MADGNRYPNEDELLFVISIAARMVGMHAQSLRHHDWLGQVRRAELQHYRDRVLPGGAGGGG